MADSNLETEFRSSVAASGEPYLAARKAILEQGPAALGILDPQRASTDWKVALTADILAGWIKTPDLFERCTNAVQGKLRDQRPVSGIFSAARRIAEIKRLGPAVTPRLLEMAVKTREYSDSKERETIFGALAVFKDSRAVLPLIDLMQTAPDESIRVWAAATLGALKDKRAVPPLLALLREPTAPAELRASTAMSLGQLNAPEAVPELRQIALDERADLELRQSAARSLGDLGNAAAAEDLLHILEQPHELAFELVILEAIGKTGGPAALPALTSLETRHHEEAIREAAKDAAEQVKDRSAVKHN